MADINVLEKEAHLSDHGDHHDDHHGDKYQSSFVDRYVFSQDHKTIAKQFLITGMMWAVIGSAMSIIFRIQLGYPDADISWLQPLLGGWIQIDPANGCWQIRSTILLRFGNNAWYNSRVFCTNSGLIRYL